MLVFDSRIAICKSKHEQQKVNLCITHHALKRKRNISMTCGRLGIAPAQCLLDAIYLQHHSKIEYDITEQQGQVRLDSLYCVYRSTETCNSFVKYFRRRD